ncbi:MAG: hypothetical protein KME52_25530 [Desmonostoc geniculatum HA4340-LM1]|nr:hypothetical protein [Desmonostoc geniculatum HA4340-LM1]
MSRSSTILDCENTKTKLRSLRQSIYRYSSKKHRQISHALCAPGITPTGRTTTPPIPRLNAVGTTLCWRLLACSTPYGIKGLLRAIAQTLMRRPLICDLASTWLEKAMEQSISYQNSSLKGII